MRTHLKFLEYQSKMAYTDTSKDTGIHKMDFGIHNVEENFEL